MIAALALALASAPTHVTTLACGASTFQLESRQFRSADAPLAPQRQAFSVVVNGRRLPVRLERLGTLGIAGYHVQRGYLLSWACVRATTGTRYVSLGYACAVDPGEPGACGDDKEWFRLVDLRGRAIDAGIPRAGGAALDRLYRRLGLKQVMGRGVTMTDALAS